VQGPDQFLSILHPPGRPAQYTHLIPRLGYLRVTPSRTAGRVDVRAFGMVESLVDVRNLVLTNTRDGATRAVPVHRVGRGHYTGRLAVDENDRLAVIVHLRGGARLRSVFEMPAEQQRSS